MLADVAPLELPLVLGHELVRQDTPIFHLNLPEYRSTLLFEVLRVLFEAREDGCAVEIVLKEVHLSLIG